MSLRLLVLGGTGFLSGEVTRQGLERGWEVTLFNRGATNPDRFPEAFRLRGDRLAGELSALETGTWDVCIDACGYVPRVVRQSCEVLAPRVGHYQFVSSISVYGDASIEGMDEQARVGRLADPTVESIDGETYGPLKALCEEACRSVFGSRATILRPGLIVGPGDPTDRFTYWPVRCSRGGDVVVPDALEQPVQIIDVRDLAAFMLDLAEKPAASTYNATGPASPMTLRTVLEACPLGSARLWAVSPSFLTENGVAPWRDLPLWLPDDSLGMATIDTRRAIAAGLRFRDVGETVATTLDWWRALDPPRELKTEIAPEREEQLLREAQRRRAARLVWGR
jgi:2'-hydroxyisoflavone reductase